MKTMSLPVLMFLACSLSFADTVTFKNGDVLTGKVVESNEKTTIIETDQGKLEVSTDKIERIEYNDRTSSQDEKYRKKNGAFIVRPLPTIVAAVSGFLDIVIEGQTALSKEWALTAIDEFGLISGVFLFSLQVGPQFRPFGTYLNGYFIGLYPGIGCLTDYTDWIWFFSITAETGYQWVFDSGFVLGLTTGFSYLTINPYISGIKWNISAHIGFAITDPLVKAK